MCVCLSLDKTDPILACANFDLLATFSWSLIQFSLRGGYPVAVTQQEPKSCSAKPNSVAPRDLIRLNMAANQNFVLMSSCKLSFGF